MLFTLHYNNNAKTRDLFKVRVVCTFLISACVPTISTALSSWWFCCGRLFYIVHNYSHSILSGFNNFSKYTNRLRMETIYMVFNTDLTLILRWTIPQTAYFQDEAWMWPQKKKVKQFCLSAMLYFFVPVINMKSLFHFPTIAYWCLCFLFLSFSSLPFSKW